MFRGVSKIVLLALVCCATSAHADLSATLRARLPANLAGLVPPAKDRPSLLKALGAPDLVEGDTVYYTLGKYKYALALRFHGARLAHFSYQPGAGNGLTAASFRKDIAAEKLASPKGHDAGSFLVYVDKSSGLTITFSNNTQKTFYSLEYEAGSAP